MRIISHRGRSENSTYKENSLDAIKYQISQGFDLEIDARFTRDKKIILSHDNFICDTQNNKLFFREHDYSYFVSSDPFFSFAFFQDVLTLVSSFPDTNFFIHLKQEEQNIQNINILFKNTVPSKNLFFFDISPCFAKYIYKNFPGFNIGPSFTLLYDKLRFNRGSLLSIVDVLLNLKYYNFIWYDQWDLKNFLGKKSFCPLWSLLLFKILHLKIALIDPDLHSFSVNYSNFFWHKDIYISYFCTNYPLKIKSLITNNEKLKNIQKKNKQ